MPQLNLLPLLFILFFAPALSAQTAYGTGTLVAEIQPRTISIDISSANRYERKRYVNADFSFRFPNRYRNFITIPRASRMDVRVVHQAVDQLLEKGWELLSSDHSVAASDAEYSNRVFVEKLVYHFRVPPSLAAGQDSTKLLVPE